MLRRRTWRRAALVLVVLLVGAAVWRVEVSVKDIEQTWPPTGAFLNVEGQRVHYVRAGEGPPVVLIHGASGNLRDWTFRIFDEMAAAHDVIAFDRPGHGYSDRAAEDGSNPHVQARILRQALATLGIERAILVGHSYGGSVALAWAVDAPEGVAGLLLLGAPSHPWEGGAGTFYDLAANRVTGPLLSNLIAWMAGDRAVDRTLTRIFAPDPVPEGYGAHVGTGLALRPETIRANARDITALKAHLRAAVAHYPDLTMPIELLHGTADIIVPMRVHSLPFGQKVPHANVVALEGAGHMLQHSRPDAVLAALGRLAAAID
ncbi:MAG: alpha/beta fold hydrolase [Pseudomonadota bacterium]